MAWLSNILGLGLNFIVDLTGSYGIAIILVTILIRLAMVPLTFSQTRSMAIMKELQPKLQEIQEKYKNNPEEYSQRTLALYKEYNVNPLGGCLPMLIQLPILWAFLQVLQNISSGEAAIFLQYWDLSKPDPYFVLPILAAATTYWQTSLTATDSSQKSMLMVMPIMIGVLSFRFPAGLVLYWVISNLFSVAQHIWIAKKFSVQGQGGQIK